MSNVEKPYVIVAACDYSETAELALEQAIEIGASRSSAELHVVNVVSLVPPAVFLDLPVYVGPRGIPITEARADLARHVEKTIERVRDARGWHADVPSPRVVAHVRVGIPAEEIAQLCADVEADLAMLGTHGRRGVARILLGSVAEGVVRLAPCPVLVVRPKKILVGPAIEPACPECVETRRSTNGQSLWCAQHSERHGQRHTYHQGDRVSSDAGLPLVFHT
jgi:nucleotide-binding universal stress UspA family protein